MSLFMHTYVLFRETEVCDSNMPFRVKKNIFRLEISVDDAVHVETSESVYYFSSVYLGSRFIELLFFAQVGEQLSTIQEINHEVQLRFCLKRKMQSNDIRVFYFL